MPRKKPMTPIVVDMTAFDESLARYRAEVLDLEYMFRLPARSPRKPRRRKPVDPRQLDLDR